MAALWPWGPKTSPFSLTNPPPQITKGKLHGSIDVRLSVMSINKKAQRIDLDTEDNIYHLKVTSPGARWWFGPKPGRGTGACRRGAGAEGFPEFDKKGVPVVYNSQWQTAPLV